MPKLALFVILASVALLDLVQGGGGGHGGHHHVIIHVPYKVKTIHHTHTITKHVHHKDSGGDKYEVLGYTVGHPIDLGGHGGGGGHDFGGGGHDFGGGDWSGGISEGIKSGGFEGSFDGGHGDIGGGHDFSGGFGGHEEYGGH